MSFFFYKTKINIKYQILVNSELGLRIGKKSSNGVQNGVQKIHINPNFFFNRTYEKYKKEENIKEAITENLRKTLCFYPEFKNQFQKNLLKDKDNYENIKNNDMKGFNINYNEKKQKDQKSILSYSKSSNDYISLKPNYILVKEFDGNNYNSKYPLDEDFKAKNILIISDKISEEEINKHNTFKYLSKNKATTQDIKDLKKLIYHFNKKDYTKFNSYHFDHQNNEEEEGDGLKEINPFPENEKYLESFSSFLQGVISGGFRLLITNEGSFVEKNEEKYVSEIVKTFYVIISCNFLQYNFTNMIRIPNSDILFLTVGAMFGKLGFEIKMDVFSVVRSLKSFLEYDDTLNPPIKANHENKSKLWNNLNRIMNFTLDFLQYFLGISLGFVVKLSNYLELIFYYDIVNKCVAISLRYIPLSFSNSKPKESHLSKSNNSVFDQEL